MCKASIVAKNVTDAKSGVPYSIGISDHGLGALHPAGTPIGETVACVKDGARVRLSQVPPTLQEHFDIGETADAIFLDSGDNVQDELEFENGEIAALSALADQGISVNIVKMPAQVDGGSVLSTETLKEPAAA